jgi:hypothetical protein
VHSLDCYNAACIYVLSQKDLSEFTSTKQLTIEESARDPFLSIGPEILRRTRLACHLVTLNLSGTFGPCVLLAIHLVRIPFLTST